MRIEQIKQDCIKKAVRAMNRTADDAERIIDESFDQYYRGGTPSRYIRKYTLPGAKDVKSPVVSGDEVTLQAGYDGSKIGYSTGKLSGEQVFEATATGSYGVVGDPSYDEQALEEIKRTAETNFSAEF